MSKYFCRNCSCEVMEQNEHVLQIDCIRALATEIIELRAELDNCDCRLADVRNGSDKAAAQAIAQ